MTTNKLALSTIPGATTNGDGKRLYALQKETQNGWEKLAEGITGDTFATTGTQQDTYAAKDVLRGYLHATQNIEERWMSYGQDLATVYDADADEKGRAVKAFRVLSNEFLVGMAKALRAIPALPAYEDPIEWNGGRFDNIAMEFGLMATVSQGDVVGTPQGVTVHFHGNAAASLALTYKRRLRKWVGPADEMSIETYPGAQGRGGEAHHVLSIHA